jgi:hypothetical protein
MIYNKKDDTYLGHTEDMAHKQVEGFLIDEKIHIVYNLGEENQYSTARPLIDIERDVDKYIWSPYAILATRGYREY